MAMLHVKLSPASAELAQAVTRVAEKGEHILLECNGAKAALISIDDLQMLETYQDKLETRLDNDAADRALVEPGENIPYDDIRKELGLS